MTYDYKEDFEAVLRRLNHEILRTVGNEKKTVTVHREDLMDAVRAIDTLRNEIRELVEWKEELERKIDW